MEGRTDDLHNGRRGDAGDRVSAMNEPLRADSSSQTIPSLAVMTAMPAAYEERADVFTVNAGRTFSTVNEESAGVALAQLGLVRSAWRSLTLPSDFR
jgi:hypothetical protein